MAVSWNFTQRAQWIPPDVSYFQFHNCSILANWVFGFLSDTTDLPYRTTARVIRDGLEEYWTKNGIKRRPNETETMIWAMTTTGGNPSLFLQAFNYTSGQCQPEFCKMLPWEGNSDLAGRGMVANYCIQAIFVTVYMAFHMATRFGWSPPRRTVLQRILVAVQESTRPFLDSTLLFSIAVHIATMFTFIRGHALSTPTPITTGISGAFISIYTIFPPLILHSCAADHLRRRHGRRYIWSFLGALSLTMIGLYFSDPGNMWHRDWWNWSDLSNQVTVTQDTLKLFFEKDPDHQLKWESFCLTQLGASRANLAFTIVLGTVFVVASFTMILLGNVFRIPFLRSERRPLLRNIRRYKWIMSAFLALHAMWMSLGIFFWFRFELNKNTGNHNKDQEWTFGQVLAVATWAPVLMEFYVLWRDGAEKGLTGLLSDRFVVVDTRDLEPTPLKPGEAASSQPSDNEDQTGEENVFSEPSSHDEQREGFMERSRTLDVNEEREKGPNRAQTIP